MTSIVEISECCQPGIYRHPEWGKCSLCYKKENPDIKLMGDSKLLMPKNINDKNIVLPKPQPVDEEAKWNEIE